MKRGGVTHLGRQKRGVKGEVGRGENNKRKEGGGKRRKEEIEKMIKGKGERNEKKQKENWRLLIGKEEGEGREEG